jgi:hypothetical protein
VQLDERLKREGVKTHKERVEELNKYLSSLSEHHDMYVGPQSFKSISICNLAQDWRGVCCVLA